MSEAVKKTYQVEIEEVRTHLYIIDEANTQDEAEATAEEWLGEGIDGAIIDTEVLNVDSYPANKEDLN